MNQPTSTDSQSKNKPLWKRWYFRLAVVVLVFLLILVSNVRKSGTVVDAETGEPIEGAIVLVEWTLTGGLPGMDTTKSSKVVEVVTDKHGRFTVLGSFNPITNKPRITIYKHGYVAWNNILIFPGTKKRQDFEWKEGNVYEMEMWDDSYSYDRHDSFVSSAIRRQSNSVNKHYFISLFDNSEKTKRMNERIGKKIGRQAR